MKNKGKKTKKNFNEPTQFKHLFNYQKFAKNISFTSNKILDIKRK